MSNVKNNIGYKECPKVLKQCTLTSFTVCPVCGLIISNGDHKYLEHPMAQGIKRSMDEE